MKYVENFDKKLEKFAEVIIKIGANVQKGQKVWINCTTDSLPLVYKVTEKAYKAGACDVNIKLTDDKLSRMHAEYKSTEEYSNIPEWTVDEINDYLDNNVVFIHILSSSPDLFSGIDAEKLGAYAKNRGQVRHVTSAAAVGGGHVLQGIKVDTPGVGYAGRVGQVVFIHLFHIGGVAAEEIRVVLIGLIDRF